MTKTTWLVGWRRLLWAVAIFGCGSPAPSSDALVLVSIDGFRWDYRDRFDTPHLDSLAARGVSARGLIPVFPTKTFPNHHSIVTGLHPSQHGIVANTIFDPARDETFVIGNDQSFDPHWWKGEPIWVTAERHGITTASYYWTGPDPARASPGTVTPTSWQPFDGSVPNDVRVQRVVRWLSEPEATRPGLVTLYFELVDIAGHDFNPDSPDVWPAVHEADSLIGLLVRGIDSIGRADNVNIIVVSDHGMAPLSRDRVILLDDYVDVDAIGIVDWNPLLAVRPADADVDEVYRTLKNAHPHLRVYRREETPERWHYRDNALIPPILGLADAGWSITTSSTFEQAQNAFTGGNHGFDNASEDMRGLFVAGGPAFRKGLVADTVRTLDLYELMARVLKIPPAPNAGSPDLPDRILR